MDAEITFLKNYHDYYIKRNGNDDNFINCVQSLIETNQISENASTKFFSILNITKEIESKTKEYKILEHQIKDLKAKLDVLVEGTSKQKNNIRSFLDENSLPKFNATNIWVNPCSGGTNIRSSC